MNIPKKECDLLRELDKKQAEMANLPGMAELKKKWYGLNDGNAEYPLVAMEFHGPEREVYPFFICENPFARELERQMARHMLKRDFYKDDRVIPAAVSVGTDNWLRPFDFFPDVYRPDSERNTDGIGYMFNHAVIDFEMDSHLFKPSVFHVDKGLSKAKDNLSMAEEILGDILPVQLLGSTFYYSPSHTFITMLDYPDLFHRVMRRLTDEYLAFMDTMEDGRALVANNELTWITMDTYCYTHDLPDASEINRPIKILIFGDTRISRKR